MGSPTKPVAGVCDECGAPVLNRTPYTVVEAVVWRAIDRHGNPSRVVSEMSTGRVRCISHADPTASLDALKLFDT